MNFDSDWIWNPQLLDKSSASYSILAIVLRNIFESSWETCAQVNDLEVSPKIIFKKYSMDGNTRRRRSADYLTSVSIELTFISYGDESPMTPNGKFSIGVQNNIQFLDITELESKLMAELEVDLLDAAENNDFTNVLPENFSPSYTCELSLTFESYDEPLTTTTILMTPAPDDVATIQNERIDQIESSISNMTEDLENLSLVDNNLSADISELEDEISDMENQIGKKAKVKRSFILLSQHKHIPI